jgi:hypothetical protein
MTLQGVNDTEDCAVPPVFTCYDPAVEGDANVRLRGVDGALFDNVHIRNAWGDGIEVVPGRGSPELNALMSSNVTLRNSTVDTVGRHGFTCSGCRNFRLLGNAATNIGYHVVDMELQTAEATGDLTLSGNTFSNYYFSIVNAVGGGREWGRCLLRKNVMSGQSTTCTPSFLARAVIEQSPGGDDRRQPRGLQLNVRHHRNRRKRSDRSQDHRADCGHIVRAQRQPYSVYALHLNLSDTERLVASPDGSFEVLRQIRRHLRREMKNERARELSLRLFLGGDCASAPAFVWVGLCSHSACPGLATRQCDPSGPG